MDFLSGTKDGLAGAFDGRNWFGPTLKSILDGIDAEDAARERLPETPSIWVIVRHITGWMEEADKCLSGRAIAPPDTWDWKPLSDRSPAAWARAISAARGSCPWASSAARHGSASARPDSNQARPPR